KAGAVAKVETLRTTRPAPARRRTKLVAGTVAAGAQLIIGAALFRILERFVGFVDGLELFLGVGILVLVRLALACQFAVGRLDVGIAGIGLDTQDLVVVLELHALSTRVRRCGKRA